MTSTNKNAFKLLEVFFVFGFEPRVETCANSHESASAVLRSFALRDFQFECVCRSKALEIDGSAFRDIISNKKLFGINFFALS